MKVITQAIPVDKNVFDFFTEIERQVSTSWIYLHNNVLQMFEKDKSFKGYEPLKRWEKDKTYTKLLKASFKKEKSITLQIYFFAYLLRNRSKTKNPNVLHLDFFVFAIFTIHQ